jgi:molecular chaperone IbpA
MLNYDLTPISRYSVGFDRMHRLMDRANKRTGTTYPPYNIEIDGEDTYRISVAVAGFEKSDLDLTLTNEELAITGKKDREANDVSYLHRGIAGRSFNLKFNLADHVKVVDATHQNGVLVVLLKREVPEELKPRKILIGTHSVQDFASKSHTVINTKKKAA